MADGFHVSPRSVKCPKSEYFSANQMLGGASNPVKELQTYLRNAPLGTQVPEFRRLVLEILALPIDDSALKVIGISI